VRSNIRPWTPPTSISRTPQGPFRSSIALTRCRTSPAASTASTRSGNEVGHWARQFLPLSGSIGPFELLTRLSQGINHGFRYRRREAKESSHQWRRSGSAMAAAAIRRAVDRRGALPRFAARFASGTSPSRSTIQRSPQETQLAGRPMPGRKSICGHRLESISIPRAQYRQDWPCHRCGRTRSAPRDPAPWHLHRVPVRPSRMEVQVSVTSGTEAIWATPQRFTWPQIRQSV